MTAYSDAVSETPQGALLRVRVTPRAKSTRLDGVHGDAVRLRIAAPPNDGKANAAVLAFLASALATRRRDLAIVRGLRGRQKTVAISGLDAASVAARLGRASG